jgi:hypothetical protein
LTVADARTVRLQGIRIRFLLNEAVMPKATVATPSGTKIIIEGTSDEVVALIARLEGLGRSADAQPSGTARLKAPTKSKQSLPGLISELIDSGFFKTPKYLGDLKEALQQNGQFYPVTTLSPTMLRLVRSRQLRRIKDNKGQWSYVG